MSIEAHIPSNNPIDEAVVCPINHRVQQKTARVSESAEAVVECDSEGIWHVYGFDEARAVLRSGDTRQAGFNAEMIERTNTKMKPPILFLEGKPHQQQRKQTARFFTPKAVDGNYRRLMESVADELIAGLRRKRQADLSHLSRFMAVRVASQVVGLTDSVLPGMDKRLDAFFGGDLSELTKNISFSALLHTWRNQLALSAFFFLDVKPAIKARKRVAQDDVISHLVAQGSSDPEILTECITYAAAGMVTTREFICVACWHLLEHDVLRQRYLAADETERYEILHELLRLEPVVGNLFRRATVDLHITHGAQEYSIPAGALINLHIHSTNNDERIVGADPLLACPGREIKTSQASAAMMSFGDGVHRCPGSYIAIQETDLFLRRLLAVEGLYIKQLPQVSWNDLVTGYEIRDFQLAIK
jgi:Cytochrome P450